MPLEAYWLIALLVCVSLGATARWVLLHPDRFFIKRMFAEPDSLRARVGRFQATFFLFGGAIGTVLYATSLMRMPYLSPTLTLPRSSENSNAMSNCAGITNSPWQFMYPHFPFSDTRARPLRKGPAIALSQSNLAGMTEFPL